MCIRDSNMPIALISTVIVITLLYTALSTAAVGLLPAADLAASDAPIAAAAANIPMIGQMCIRDSGRCPSSPRDKEPP